MPIFHKEERLINIKLRNCTILEIGLKLAISKEKELYLCPTSIPTMETLTQYLMVMECSNHKNKNIFMMVIFIMEELKDKERFNQQIDSKITSFSKELSIINHNLQQET